MHKIMESKPNPNILVAINKLRDYGFNPVMLGSLNYNRAKIRKVGKQKIVKVLVELSKKEGTLRKRLLSFRNVYAKYEEFIKKVERYDDELLAAVLKRVIFLAQTKVYLFWIKDRELPPVALSERDTEHISINVKAYK